MHKNTAGKLSGNTQPWAAGDCTPEPPVTNMNGSRLAGEKHGHTAFGNSKPTGRF